MPSQSNYLLTCLALLSSCCSAFLPLSAVHTHTPSKSASAKSECFQWIKLRSVRFETLLAARVSTSPEPTIPRSFPFEFNAKFVLHPLPWACPPPVDQSAVPSQGYNLACLLRKSRRSLYLKEPKGGTPSFPCPSSYRWRASWEVWKRILTDDVSKAEQTMHFPRWQAGCLNDRTAV